MHAVSPSPPVPVGNVSAEQRFKFQNRDSNGESTPSNRDSIAKSLACRLALIDPPAMAWVFDRYVTETCAQSKTKHIRLALPLTHN